MAKPTRIHRIDEVGLAALIAAAGLLGIVVGAAAAAAIGLLR